MQKLATDFSTETKQKFNDQIKLQYICREILYILELVVIFGYLFLPAKRAFSCVTDCCHLPVWKYFIFVPPRKHGLERIWTGFVSKSVKCVNAPSFCVWMNILKLFRMSTNNGEEIKTRKNFEVYREERNSKRIPKNQKSP